MSVDTAKCEALKAELAALPPRETVIPIQRFFDGNHDLASLGCNLIEHPGIEAFREKLTALLSRPDVKEIYARIVEIDPGKDCWPFTDTLFVVGTISVAELREILKLLQPDEVGPGEHFEIPSSIKLGHHDPVLAAWWD
jgi:hypothetical protein